MKSPWSTKIYQYLSNPLVHMSLRAIIMHKSGLWEWSTRPCTYSSSDHIQEYKWISKAFDGKPPISAKEYETARISILKQWRMTAEGHHVAHRYDFDISLKGPFSESVYPLFGMTNEMLIQCHRQAVLQNPNTYVVCNEITIYRDWKRMVEFEGVTTVKECIPILKNIIWSAGEYLSVNTGQSVLESDKHSLLHNWIDVINIITADKNNEFFTESLEKIWHDTVHRFIGQKFIHLV